jgi:hypothetical protein
MQGTKSLSQVSETGMFEQSVLPEARTRRPYAFIAVTTGEVIALTLATVVPLFYIPALVPPKLPMVLRYWHAVPLVETQPGRRPAVASPRRVFVPPRAFYAPQRIPERVIPAAPLSLEEAPALNHACRVDQRQNRLRASAL